jgi:hypothetical protein
VRLPGDAKAVGAVRLLTAAREEKPMLATAVSCVVSQRRRRRLICVQHDREVIFLNRDAIEDLAKGMR